MASSERSVHRFQTMPATDGVASKQLFCQLCSHYAAATIVFWTSFLSHFDICTSISSCVRRAVSIFGFPSWIHSRSLRPFDCSSEIRPALAGPTDPRTCSVFARSEGYKSSRLAKPRIANPPLLPGTRRRWPQFRIWTFLILRRVCGEGLTVSIVKRVRVCHSMFYRSSVRRGMLETVKHTLTAQ